MAILGQNGILFRSTFLPVTREGERLSENDRRPFMIFFLSSTKCLSQARAESLWLARSSKKKSKKMRRWGNLRSRFLLTKKMVRRGSAAPAAHREKRNATNKKTPAGIWLNWNASRDSPRARKKKGVMRESNSRPLAPEARIIPLDQSPAAKKKRGDARIELATSCTQSKNHTTRPITRSGAKRRVEQYEGDWSSGMILA